MGNPFKAILGFFKKLGRKLGGALVSVGKHISEEQFDYALAVVQTAVDRFTDNANRRTWAVHEVQTKFGLSESIARMAVELAVHTLKQGEQRLFEQLDEILTPEVEGVIVPGDDETEPGPVLGEANAHTLSPEEEAAQGVEIVPAPEGDYVGGEASAALGSAGQTESV